MSNYENTDIINSDSFKDIRFERIEIVHFPEKALHALSYFMFPKITNTNIQETCIDSCSPNECFDSLSDAKTKIMKINTHCSELITFNKSFPEFASVVNNTLNEECFGQAFTTYILASSLINQLFNSPCVLTEFPRTDDVIFFQPKDLEDRDAILYRCIDDVDNSAIHLTSSYSDCDGYFSVWV